MGVQIAGRLFFKGDLHFQDADAGVLLRRHEDAYGLALQRGGGMDNVVLIGAVIVAVGGVELERLPFSSLQNLK